MEASTVSGEIQVTTGSLTGEMWINTNTGSRMFIGKYSRGLPFGATGSDQDVSNLVNGTDVGFTTVDSDGEGNIHLSTGDGIFVDDRNHWYTSKQFHIGGESQFIKYDGLDTVSMSAEISAKTGSFQGQMWVNTNATDRMYIGKYAGGFTVSGDVDVDVNRQATDEDGTSVDIGFYLNDSGSIIALSDGDGIKVNDYNYWYTNREYAIGNGSEYIRYDEGNGFQIYVNSSTINEITASGTISSSGTGSFGRLEAAAISATSITASGRLEAAAISTTSITASTISVDTTGSFGRIETPGIISASGTIFASTFNDDGQNLNVPDYVFDGQYKLRTINQLETFVSESKHLPGVPSTNDKQEWSTHSMGDRDMILLEKIEELSLYVIELNKRIEKLESKRNISND